MIEQFKYLAQLIGYGVEGIGVLVIVFGSIYAGWIWLRNGGPGRDGSAYHALRRRLGRAIIIGLEFLIAGDIIRTVAVHHSWEGLGGLAIIVLIRTFLSFTLFVEIEGRWPWQQPPESENV
jgi:uncharacterized membrane protein